MSILPKIILVLPIIVCVYYGLSHIESVSEKEITLTRDRLNLASELYDRHGVKIGEFAREKRYFVPLAKIPLYVVEAFLSIEDSNFFSHRGIDYFSTLRALLTNLFSLQIKQGGSTITQQLARMLFLHRERTWLRKSKEAQIAQILEKKYAKSKIIEYYLNTVYLGNGAYGVESASRSYFRKPIAQVNLAEAALLAALPKAPSSLAPHRNYPAARKRQQLVLQRMFADKIISVTQYQETMNKKIRVYPHPRIFTEVAPYFRDQVEKVLRRKFSLIALKTKGYQIHTSLDHTWQKKITSRFRTRIDLLHHKFGSELQSAFMVMNPRNGEVLAVQGGSNYSTTQFNRALYTRRRSQQMLMPFIIALTADIGPNHRGLNDINPVFARLYASLLQHRTFSISNLLAVTGAGSIHKALRPFGIKFAVDTAEIDFTLEQITALFATLAHAGQQVVPSYVLQIANNVGERLYTATSSKSVRAFSPASAFVVNAVLRVFLKQESDNTTADLSGFTCVNRDRHDAWALGYNSNIAVGVWLGAERGRIKLPPQTNLALNLFQHTFKNMTKGSTPKSPQNVAFVSLKIRGQHDQEKYISLPVPL